MSPRAFADLTALLDPASVAVVGASERAGSLGAVATDNLLRHSRFDGRVHLVNERSPSVFGRQTVSNVEALTEAPDVALVVVPRDATVDVVAKLGDLGTRFAVVMSSGFGEAGEVGRTAQDALAMVSASTGIRIVGPNSPGLGVIGRPLGLTIQPGFRDDLRAGSIGVVAQSGGLTRCLLQGANRGIGFSAFFSPGNQVDLDVADYIHHLALDGETRVIAAAIEGVPDARRLGDALEVARQLGKPVIMLKTGRSAAGRRAAASHTGALVGTAEAARAAARRFGVTLVDDIDQLAIGAAHLARGARPRRGGAAVYGLSGGAGVLFADALGDRGRALASLDAATGARLAPYVAATADPTANPVDVGGPGLFEPGAFAAGLRVVAEDPAVGAVAVMLNAWYAGHTRRFVESCVAVADEVDIPIVPVWMSERRGDEFDALDEARLPALTSVSAAAGLVAGLLGCGDDAADQFADEPGHDVSGLRTELSGLEPGLVLSDAPSQRLLAAAGWPVVRPVTVTDRHQADVHAADLGFPVILKASSSSVLHRAGTGMVSGPIADRTELQIAWEKVNRGATAHAGPEGYEMVLATFVTDGVEAHVGVVEDVEWGPVVSVGLGGRMIEIIADSQLVTPDASMSDAVDAIARTRLATEYRRRWPDGSALDHLARLVVNVASLVSDPSPVSELDLNPVVLTARSVHVVDALIVTARRPLARRQPL